MGGCQQPQLSSCCRQRDVSGPVPAAWAAAPTLLLLLLATRPPRRVPPARGSQLAPTRSALSCVKRGRFSAPLHRTHPEKGEEAAGAAPGDARRREGSRDARLPGCPNPLGGGFFGRSPKEEKQSQHHGALPDPLLRLGWLGPATGVLGHQTGTLSPGTRVALPAPSSTDRPRRGAHTVLEHLTLLKP